MARTQLWLMTGKGKRWRGSVQSAQHVQAAFEGFHPQKRQPFLQRSETTRRPGTVNATDSIVYEGLSSQAFWLERLWPQYEQRYTSAPCKLQNESWKAAHACKDPSLPQSTFNHLHWNFHWPACRFLSYFSLSPTQFLWWLFEDLSSTLFFPPLSFLQGKSWERLMWRPGRAGMWRI